ncbi:MAG: hypothetical protein ACREO3_10705 [Arenimonas sp.]
MALAGCMTYSMDRALVLPRADARAIAQVVYLDAPCLRVNRLASCPANYRNPDVAGKCVLAFVQGEDVADSRSRFFSVYVQGGSAEVVGYFSGQGDDPDPLQITSGACSPY